MWLRVYRLWETRFAATRAGAPATRLAFDINKVIAHMTKNADLSALETRLDTLLANLLNDTRASRCTIRIDDPARGWSVDFVCAEAVRPGVNSLRGDGSIDQRAAGTVKWLAENKRNLVQPDIVNNPDPAPPPALTKIYAAKAQMLGPLLAEDGGLSGWFSVHYVDSAHSFTNEEQGALDRACQAVSQLVGIAVSSQL
jgi:maleate isomerase